jgi:choline dehydrogenase-like flavoprotein
MTEPFDVVIIGTGPAGASAAFPLVERGLRVLMVDGGSAAIQPPPQRDYLSLRREDPSQWKWMIGENFHALRSAGPARASPKFRAPTLEGVFKDFSEANAIDTDNFAAVGSIVTGGLSNAWGCGVSRFDEQDVASFPVRLSDLMESYERVARRIGISGRCDDDLSSYHGVDQWAQPALALDSLQSAVVRSYQMRRSNLAETGFRLGRSRVAVLSEDIGERQKCTELGTCLWGCARGSLYTSRDEIVRLRRLPNVMVRTNFIARRLRGGFGSWIIEGQDRSDGSTSEISGRIVLVAAGCLATSRIVYDSLDLIGEPRRLLSNPSAAFLVFFPRWIGSGARKGHKLSLLSFAFDAERWGGFLFATDGLPVSEFVDSVPLPSRYAIDVLKYILPASLVGNIFLPGALSQHTMSLGAERRLKIVGGLSEAVVPALADAKRRLTKAFRRMGGVLPSRGFLTAVPGSDVHYVGGTPMRERPARGDCEPSGEVAGMPGVFVVDGASLPSLPSKSPTLTIMANADRIARLLTQRWDSLAFSFPK